MDTKKTENNHQTLSKKLKASALIVGLLGLGYWGFATPNEAASVAHGNLLIGTVQYGDLDVKVDGFGVLRAARQKILVAGSRGTVEEILLKPGAPVTADSVILKLSNPALEQQTLSASQQLALLQGDLRQLKLTNERDLLAEEANLASIRAQLETAKLNRIAKAELVKKGITSTLELKAVELEESQLSARFDIQNRRYRQLKLVHRESLKNHQQRIELQQGELDMYRSLIEKLTVRAGMAGVLQRLPVELGQGLTQGQQLAQVSGTDELVAMVQVPQSRVSQIVVGQSATIDTRKDKINGKVSRIDPAVVDGYVTIEVALEGPLPTSARPELNIDAVILTEQLSNVFYVEKPTNAAQDAQVKVFKVNASEDKAEQVQVALGVDSGRYVQVLSGLEKGDKLILSDLSKFAGMPEISVIK